MLGLPLFGGVAGYISSGGDWGAVARSAAVGFGAGFLSTLGIPGAQAILGQQMATLASGIIMESTSGFLGNIGSQLLVEGKSLDRIDYDSAMVSGFAGAVGGAIGAGAAGITSRQGLTVLTEYGSEIVSSTVGGISAGTYDAILH